MSCRSRYVRSGLTARSGITPFYAGAGARSYKAVVLDFALFLIALFALSIFLICGCFYIVSDSRQIGR